MLRPKHMVWAVFAAVVCQNASWADAVCFDWRHYGPQDLDYITPVRDQGSVGTCWAFAAVAALESKVEITAQNPNLNLDLSEQNLLCAAHDGYVDGDSSGIDWSGMGSIAAGQPFGALNYMWYVGIASESELPYTQQDTSPNWPLKSGWQNRVYKLSSYASWAHQGSVFELKYHLEHDGPLVACMNSSTDFFTPPVGPPPANSPDIESTTPILPPTATDDNNHAALVVGFVDDSRAKRRLLDYQEQSWNWLGGRWLRLRSLRRA